MSSSDSQNVSGRDYNEGDEAGNDSYTRVVLPSTRSTKSRMSSSTPKETKAQYAPRPQPKKLAPLAGENRLGGDDHSPGGSLPSDSCDLTMGFGFCFLPGQSEFLTQDLKLPESFDSRSKKMVLLNSDSVQQQECLLTRAEVDEIHSLLRGRITYKRTRAFTGAASKISSEVYDYFIFQTPEDYKKANLEPLDYSREGKYKPKTIATMATATGSSQGMVLDKGFISAPNAPRPPRGKVALGAKKVAVAKGTSDPPRL
nr:hypothetical protein Iba_chr13aCG10690 [Ipomoea batatas]